MFEVRIHGRGGQGVVTAAEMLSMAAFREGQHAQAFPSFGSERTGAPVVAYCRISPIPIRVREPVMRPDALIVQDATLLHQVDVFAGMREHGSILINSSRTVEGLGITDVLERAHPRRVMTIPATDLAMEHLGLPKPNAVLLGGLAALTEIVSIDAVVAAIDEVFSGKLAASNVAAARAAHDVVDAQMQSAGTAPQPSRTDTEEELHAAAD